MPDLPRHVLPTIMIVEDEIIIAADLKMRLGHLGYHVCCQATSGEEALEMAEKAPPDLVLMDIILAGRMDGIEAASHLRRRFGLPVIFMTAYADEERLELAKVTEPFGYILKPIQDRDLKVTLEMALYKAEMDARRQRDEERIGESERAFKALLDAATDTAYLLDTGLNILALNETAAQRLGLRPEEMKERHILDFFPENVAGLRKKKFDELFETHQPVRWVDERAGIIFDNNIRPVLDGQGNLARIAVFARDITEQKTAEDRLRVSEEKYRLLAENTKDVIWVTDLHLRPQYVSPSVEAFLGYSVGESLNLSLEACLTPASLAAVRQAWAEGRALEAGNQGDPHRVWQIELEFIRKDGSTVWGESRITYRRDAAGRPLLIQGVTRDITDRKKAEEGLKAAFVEKEVLLREIHHRVKNNLQVVSSLLNIQAGRRKVPGLDEALRESRNRVAAMALVHEMLYRSTSLAEIDLAAYLSGLSRTLIQAYSTGGPLPEMCLSVPDGLAVGLDQAVPCGLVLNELISNSIKHAFPRGRPGRIVIQAEQDREDRLTLVVRDDGVGLPADLDWRRGGTLGLSLVNGLVETQLKGEISLDRKEGTTWTIRFRPRKK
ncbi:MAG: PAS domain S-box protein [Thermodesulfobacteriota bacterium]